MSLLWDEPKAKKDPPRTPGPVWVKPAGLPNLEEALRFDIHVMTDAELLAAQAAGERLLFDVECYPNYFLASFRSVVTGWCVYFELSDTAKLETEKLRWVFQNFTTVGFNSISYDLPIATLALAGKTTAQLQVATNRIIVDNVRGRDLLKSYRVKPLEIDHIDLIEVAPGKASLKMYGGRLHAPRMQDLPFAPGSVLTPDQQAVVRWYNVNSDLTATAFLYMCLRQQIELREQMSSEYGVDLRSKSDAQVAEAVIVHEMTQWLGYRPEAAVVEPGTSFKYLTPDFIRYQSPLMQHALKTIEDAVFVVSETGHVEMPKPIKDLDLQIANSRHNIGIGGLHSCEKSAGHRSDENYVLVDRDVTSYYPATILNLGMYPKGMGKGFLKVYRSIVDRRLHAKKTKNKVVADSLKITINGSFGKFGSKYSKLYAPDLMIRVTITGQLAILMLIEALELAGIPVVSANTDGIVVKCPRSMTAQMDSIVAAWEVQTGYGTEETEYAAIYSRDVNNYFAIKTDGKVKTKGVYFDPWSDPTATDEKLKKNPVVTICSEAVKLHITKGVPLAETIRGCSDIRKFVVVHNVTGGAVKDSVYLGKAVRWYYAVGETGHMQYANSGDKVPTSDGAKPCMDLPSQFPSDVDFGWYEKEAESILFDIGFLKKAAPSGPVWGCGVR